MNISIGINDFTETFRLRRLWIFWGWLDIRQRYRRSILGPFWVTMTMGISILATGLVYAFLFKQELASYLPYVASGYVIWALISGYVGDACSVFIQNEGFINQLKLPFSIYPVRLLWRYVIMFLHHSVILGIVLFLFLDTSVFAIVAAILGLCLTSVNLLWIGTLLGLLSVRARDLPILVSTIFQVMFLVTPVIWPAKALGTKSAIVLWNPFYHLLEVIRSPLISGITSLWWTHVIVSLAMAVIGIAITVLFLSSWRRRLVFWL